MSAARKAIHVIIDTRGGWLTAYHVGWSTTFGADFRNFVARSTDGKAVRDAIERIYPSATHDVTIEAISHSAWLKRERAERAAAGVP